MHPQTQFHALIGGRHLSSECSQPGNQVEPRYFLVLCPLKGPTYSPQKTFHSVQMLFSRTTALWCVARQGGSKSNTINLILRLFLYHFLHTMSSWHHESIHNNTNNQQTPPPWWWSRLPLQRRGFNESTPSKWQAALRIHFLRPLLKGLVKFNKLM